MAKGFAAGLFHGALICGAGLAALSLAVPVTKPLPDPAPSVSPVAVIPEPAPAPQPTSTTTDSGTGPAAETLTVPEDSEFARGTDLAPTAPAPMAAVAPRATAPMVAAPADETVPATADPAIQPEARAEAPAPAVIQTPEGAAIDLPMIAPESPAPVEAATRIAPPGPDHQPDKSPDLGFSPDPASAPAAKDASGAGFNLSTPPDIGALRLTEPN
ncbi:hypothetical protein [Paracoccus aestuariivivens]|uniref:Uncharacterized protein n=1 Tax=Paracoccus aestuariivivens TaxID=1820333 RepID=A0A6L6J6U1_9RHOB|nr:hypothetical protein [Paracoccus aestuariivivens]MTH76357.1 hypothetical protein [Paracoccus aestuariivivens]